MEAARDVDDIFVYMGGDQEVPDFVRRARIHISVKIVQRRAFYQRRRLISVDFHDGVEIIEEEAFYGCQSLRGVKLLGVRNIKKDAFYYCKSMTAVEFGDRLETIGQSSFHFCTALTNVRMPSMRTIGESAFSHCNELSDVEFGDGLRTIQYRAFRNCPELKRIALPLKDDMIKGSVFLGCPKLATVDLVGGIHQTVAALHLESWRNEMNNRVNQVLRTTSSWDGKTDAIKQWMDSVIRQLDHYKNEHHQMLKEATTLLELALWKANLDDNNGGEIEIEGVRTTRSRKRARKEICVTSGADVVIKNVLPFLPSLK